MLECSMLRFVWRSRAQTNSMHLWFGFEEDFVRYLMADGIHMPSKGAKDDAASDGSWGSGSFRMQWWMM